MLKTYIQFIKPGYIFGTGITAITGFILASKGHINLYYLAGAMIGISFGIASACVFNNYIDREIDGKMERTKNRALVIGAISPNTAVFLGLIFGFIGVVFLAIFTNLITLIAGAVGLFFYEVFYSISKRSSSWSTVIGSVAGAIPPVAGYTAVSGKLDLGAVLLFFIFASWQMPHFYAIAIYRRSEYEKAGLPVLPVAKGIYLTKIHILLYTIAFAIVTSLLFFTGYTGKIYFSVAITLSLFWISYVFYGFWVKNTDEWARRMFFSSLLINFMLCTLIMVTIPSR